MKGFFRRAAVTFMSLVMLGTAGSNIPAAAEQVQLDPLTASDTAFEDHMRSQGFPESYKPYLRTMHSKHPKWVFTAQKTGLDWNTVLA
ncbi:MAG: hypothetical protein IIZ73_01045, partial [Ruminococcus sp.]|nr:hypothetical protein [Ruminococcus sp.]